MGFGFFKHFNTGKIEKLNMSIFDIPIIPKAYKSIT